METDNQLHPILAKSLEFKIDWDRLWNLPFRRGEKSGDLFKRVYLLRETARNHPDHGWLELIKEWLLMPYSLWRIPCDGLAAYLCDLIEAGKRFDPHLLLLLELLDDLPSEEEQQMIMKFERSIQKGDYSWLVPGGAKYDAKEKELLANTLYSCHWDKLKQAFELDKFRDRYGIVRRTPAQERNFHPKDWSTFLWDNEQYRFQTIFDAFACRWILYGVEQDHPLLQKLTLNPTAIGWIGYWPAYWSPDGRRDLAWREFNDAQKARGVKRQGPKMSEGRVARQEQYKAAYLANLAVKDKMRGAKRMDFVIGKAGLSPHIDAGTFRRIIREGEKLWKAENEARSSKLPSGTVNVAPAATAGAQVPTSNLKPAASTALETALRAFGKLSPEEKDKFFKAAKMENR